MSSLFRKLTRSIRPPTYANTGSVARDHLASERTFLAWIRTGLGFVALGIAVERFSQLDLESLIDHLLPDRPRRGVSSSSSSLASPAVSLHSTESSNSNPPSAADLNLQRQQEQTEAQAQAEAEAEASRKQHEQETRTRQTREQLLVGTLLGSGGGSIVYGVTRYFSTMRMLERGMFVPSYFGAAGLGILVSGMAGGAYWGTLKRELERVAEGSNMSEGLSGSGSGSRGVDGREKEAEREREREREARRERLRRVEEQLVLLRREHAESEGAKETEKKGGKKMHVGVKKGDEGG